MTTYDAAFFEYVNSGAIGSAEQLLPLLVDNIEINSVLDIGCGQGAWLTVWKRLGIDDLTGVDGDYVDREALLVGHDRFISHDLTKDFDLNRRYDLVQSLEVAEHLPEDCAARFVSSLVRHSGLVLFSAAAKGQGGDNHVNEQDYDYWRALFFKHGYIAVDYLRPLILHDARIEPWYRYNTFLYASPERFQILPISIQKCRVDEGDALVDLSPLLYKFRKAIVGLLPVSTMSRMAKLKERFVAKSRRHK